jgi:hypothetical protein
MDTCSGRAMPVTSSSGIYHNVCLGAVAVNYWVRSLQTPGFLRDTAPHSYATLCGRQ